jgi:hypothetical protein
MNLISESCPTSKKRTTSVSMKLENALRKVFSQCPLLPLLIKFPCHRFALSADPRFYREILATESTSNPSLRVIFPNWMWLNIVYIYLYICISKFNPSFKLLLFSLFVLNMYPFSNSFRNWEYHILFRIKSLILWLEWSEVNAGLSFNTH